MSCTDFSSYGEFLRAGQFFDAVYCPFGDLLGGAVFALLFFGVIALALYVYTDSVAVPVVVTILIGSVVVVQLPPEAVNITGIMLVLGIVGAGYLIVRTFETTR